MSQDSAAGESKPGVVARSLIEVDLLHARTQLLVDTGAKLSCVSEQLLQCNELFRDAKIRKSDRRAYGVNGEPVVTLGIVDLSFRIEGCTFSHSFTILRGLIHPMLLGMDFLTKYKACIDLGDRPRMRLTRTDGRVAFAAFLKAVPKQKPMTHVALTKGIEIPPHSFYYADAYIANIESAVDLEENSPRLMGITAIQKQNEFFDPGFILRDGIISADAHSFKVELANPSQFPLRVAEDTPLGVIFDYDCTLVEGDAGQAIEGNTAVLEEVVHPPPCQATQSHSPSGTGRGTSTLATCQTQHDLSDPPVRGLGTSTTATCQTHTDSSTSEESPESECVATAIVTDGPVEVPLKRKLLYSDIHGKDKSQKERTYMVDMDGAEYTPEQRSQLEAVLEAGSEAFALNDREMGCTDVICHHVKITNPRPVYITYNKAQGADIRKEIDDQTNSMLADGILKESESPFCCPIVMVKKKYGGWRYCVDLRRINQMTEKVSFPMPRIEDALRKLKRPKYFSSMDLLKAYYQIPVAEEDQKYRVYQVN